jgi:phospholipid/cholesterol/gamma-HCH transport system ATP-binding protein
MTAPLIEVRDLVVGWDGELLLEHASFDVHDGEVFAVLGGSGSGKSTLMRSLVGLDSPPAGSVFIRGLGAPTLDAARPAFGVMFQQGALLGSMTVGENLALPIEHWTDLPPDAVSALVRAKLALVGLEAAEHKLPSELSGGMRKRAAIARAMALEPTLVFLDEPSSGLDPITSAELDELIVTLKRGLGLTVVLVTHDLGSILGIVDRCIMLDRASRSIIAAGTPRVLAASPDPRVHAFFTRSPLAPARAA